MKVTLDTVLYSNTSDRIILQSCMQNWFRNPKDLQFTDPRMSYPFDFRKWCSLSYKEKNTKTFVIKKDKWIIGYISLKTVPEKKQAHLFHLFVDKEYRQLGLARMLIDHVVKLSKDLHLNYITLNVTPKNERAIIIYKAAGFEENGITSSGSVKMKKLVDQ